ncbi:MAG TPA: hypothetical protein VMM16_02535 [Verrucomicrobiae bacterium]|nr:hypothetical protein [Verrucomicrobiae bacterium]
MILGMTTFTFVHVALSLIGILTGLIVALGLLASVRLDSLTAIFLLTTALTSITGFLFPFRGVTPGIVIGILSVVTLAIAILARYGRKLAGPWRWIYAVTLMISLYLNVFVLIVQLFEKVPALRALAPTKTEPPFKMTQLAALIVFFVWTIFAAVRFRPAAD